MKVIQLTDLHLCKSEHDLILNQNPYDKLSKIIDKIIEMKHHYDAILLVTGDISNDGTIESYELAIKQLERLNILIYFTPGNHDNKDVLTKVFSQSKLIRNLRDLAVDGWNIINVNSTLIDSDSGFITASDLLKIKSEASKNTAIIMHHHPVPVGTPLVDECMIINGVELMRTIKLNQNIRLIICGHAHGNYKIQNENCIVEVCPATCFQWKRGTDTLSIENTSGFKEFNFSQNSYSSYSYLFNNL
ncbi:metallophosphoesterase [Serratia fonticola]|uniref:metallophosphoesterase n=1 Tax=Serratia fonticola TaxID=47917 RepID=UPI00301E117A